MARASSFSISVYPLVLKFLTYHYDTKPFDITRVTNPYATYLYACLDRHDYLDKMVPKKYSRLTERLPIELAAWRVKRFGTITMISPRKVSCFNDFVRQMFFEKFTYEVTLNMAFGMGLRMSTERFLDRYGITEDDLPIDTALRYYARYRRKMEKANAMAGVSLFCCPETPPADAVILPHERDSANWQMEPGRRAVA